MSKYINIQIRKLCKKISNYCIQIRALVIIIIYLNILASYDQDYEFYEFKCLFILFRNLKHL